jgi:hypothetical protein
MCRSAAVRAREAQGRATSAGEQRGILVNLARIVSLHAGDASSVASIIVDALGNEHKIGNAEIEGEGDSGRSKVGEESACTALVGTSYFACSASRAAETSTLDKTRRTIRAANPRTAMSDERGTRAREGLPMRFVTSPSSHTIRKAMLRPSALFAL